MPENTYHILRDVVQRLKYKPGWMFTFIDDDAGFRLRFTDWNCIDAYNPGKPFPLSHYAPIPVATYNEASWTRWVFDRLREIEDHESGEWFVVGDHRPFAPTHGPGENPYVVHEYRPYSDALVRQDGSMREK